MRYRERLHPAAWIWAVAVILGVGMGLSMWPIGPLVGASTALGVCFALVALLILSTPVISVGDGRLRAGRAHIPIGLTGRVHELDAAAMRRAHGVELDARAYLCLRGWIASGVRVDLIDPDDPTPYWLISSRHPDRLVRALLDERG